MLSPVLQAGGKKLDVSALNALVSEYRLRDDFEVTHLGLFSTALLKKAARMGSRDSDTRTALAMIEGVRSLTVVDFSDSPEPVHSRFASRVDRILQSTEVLMEMKDDDSCVRIYGLPDDAAGKLRDIVLFDAAGGTLLFVGGSISMDALRSLRDL